MADPKPKPKSSKKPAAPRESKHSLSGQFRELIVARGLTAYALGQATGVSPTVIGRFLAGERDVRLGTADKLAEAMGLRLVEVAAKPKARGRPAKKGVEG